MEPGPAMRQDAAAGRESSGRESADGAVDAQLRRTRGRQAALLVVVGVVMLALAGRVAWWQLAQHATLAARANAEHLRATQLPAGRGDILDANGAILAISVTRDTVIADPDVIRQNGALTQTAQALALALGLPAGLVRSELAVSGGYAVVRDTSGSPLLLSQAQSAAVNAAIAQGTAVGVALYPQVIREYPDGSLAAQTLGFVRASDGVGQYGVELSENGALAGRSGVIYTAVDAQGNPIATAPQRQTPAVPGSTVTLTLDANIQYWAEQGLAQAIQQTGAVGGTVLVMDPSTGAILAMANAPSFDPNSYGAAPLADLNNPAVSAVYDPGSTMKAVTMAAGVQNGRITPDTTFFDTGSTQVDGVTIWNFDHHGHGEETMTQVLQYSANVGAIWVAQRVGATLYYRNLAAFGFGQPTGVDLPNESAGLLTRPSAPGLAQLTLAENSFGESIGVTPLQMVSAWAALANGGLLMRPYVVASVTNANGATTRYSPQVIRRAVSRATAWTVTQMLVNSSRVSEAEMWRVNGYSVAAKTGTSTPDPADPTITYASVLGYAPASHPRFVLLVKLDHPRDSVFGGAAAGPLWRALAEQLFAYYRIPPDLAS